MVERDGLENRCTGNRTVGSNPTLSAIFALAAGSLRSMPAPVQSPCVSNANRQAEIMLRTRTGARVGQVAAYRLLASSATSWLCWEQPVFSKTAESCLRAVWMLMPLAVAWVRRLLPW